jgi:hypothetical protein
LVKVFAAGEFQVSDMKIATVPMHGNHVAPVVEGADQIDLFSDIEVI